MQLYTICTGCIVLFVDILCMWFVPTSGDMQTAQPWLVQVKRLHKMDGLFTTDNYNINIVHVKVSAIPSFHFKCSSSTHCKITFMWLMKHLIHLKMLQLNHEQTTDSHLIVLIQMISQDQISPPIIPTATATKHDICTKIPLWYLTGILTVIKSEVWPW